MTYRPRALHASVAGSIHAPRRISKLNGMPVSAPGGSPSHPGLLVGLLYGLPPALLLWAIIVLIAKALF